MKTITELEKEFKRLMQTISFRHELGTFIHRYRYAEKKWDSDGFTMKDISLFDFSLWVNDKSVQAIAERTKLKEEFTELYPDKTLDTLHVNRKDYEKLLHDARQYQHLINIGVDNWEHYTYLGDGR